MTLRAHTAERFEAKVDRSGGPDACHLWAGAKIAGGYGVIKVRPRTLKAHRVAYELAHGPIPSGEGHHGTCVLHRCDVRACVNPAHLFLGTNNENMADMVAKGRHSHGASNPRSKLADADVVSIRAMRARGDLYEAIAKHHGCSRTLVRNVCAGRTRAHVAPALLAAVEVSR